MPETLLEDTRKELFRKLVDGQDQGLTVGDSRRQVAEQYHITSDEVRVIEQEGITNQWPPL